MATLGKRRSSIDQPITRCECPQPSWRLPRPAHPVLHRSSAGGRRSARSNSVPIALASASSRFLLRLTGRSLACRSRTGYRTPTPVTAPVLAGMNGAINAHGYTQAAFWNWLPVAVWWLMVAIALCSNALCGFRPRNSKAATKLAFVLPFVIAMAFLLIADIDAPRRGLTHARPQNLEALVKSFDR
jgi:hypothetical protein